MPPDITVENLGNLYLLRTNNGATYDFLYDSVQQNATWIGNTLVVEPRYVAPILMLLQGAGFTQERR